MSKHITKTCENCSKEFMRKIFPNGKIEDMRDFMKPRRRYCSRICASIAREAAKGFSPQIISRHQALLQGQQRYFTGEPCHRSHLAERSCSNGSCLHCQRLYEAKYRSGNLAKISERKRRRYEALA